LLGSTKGDEEKDDMGEGEVKTNEHKERRSLSTLKCINYPSEGRRPHQGGKAGPTIANHKRTKKEPRRKRKRCGGEVQETNPLVDPLSRRGRGKTSKLWTFRERKIQKQGTL